MTPDQAAMLVRMDQKLLDISVRNNEEHAAIKLKQDIIDSRMDETKKEVYAALNHRPKWDIIMWLLAGVFTCLIIVAGLAYKTEVNLSAHITTSKRVFHQLTGVEFDDRDGTEVFKEKE